MDDYSFLEPAFKKIFDLVNAPQSAHFRFTSGSAAAVAELYYSHYIESVRITGKTHFLTTNAEDAPILLGAKKLEDKLSCKAKSLEISKEDGRLPRQKLWEAITERTSLVSMCLANSLTGIIAPIDELSSVCKEHGVPLHVDAGPALGIIPIDFTLFDYLTFDGSAISATYSGGIFSKEKLPAFAIGEERIDKERIELLGNSAFSAKEKMTQNALEYARIREGFEQEVKRILPNTVLHFQEWARLPHLSVLSFPKVPAELLLFHLTERGVKGISMGGGKSQKLSYLLKNAYGINPSLAESALSVSLQRPEKEADNLLNLLEEIVPKLESYF